MQQQLERVCRENNATCESWNYNSRANNPPTIILVTVEKTVDPQFHEYVVQLVNENRLARIIVDEAHLAVAHLFRSIMHTLIWAASRGVQLVLQTATMPPSIEGLIFKAFGVTAYSVVRASTARPNISYNVIRVADDNEMYGRCESLIDHILHTQGHGSVLIFCKSRNIAEEFGQRNNIPFCHAKLSKPEIDTILKQLHTGKIRAVIATTLLSVSLNEASVTDVIHLDYPFDALGYIQETGRTGRDPSVLCWSYVIVVEGTPERRTSEDLLGSRLVRASIDNTSLCRRLLVWGFNDGTALPCSMLQGNVHYCDVCSRMSSLLPIRGARINFTTEMIQQYLPNRGKSNNP
jgi:superfamily II DNA helicase RecQ